MDRHTDRFQLAVSMLSSAVKGSNSIKCFPCNQEGIAADIWQASTKMMTAAGSGAGSCTPLTSQHFVLVPLPLDF